MEGEQPGCLQTCKAEDGEVSRPLGHSSQGRMMEVRRTGVWVS